VQTDQYLAFYLIDCGNNSLYKIELNYNSLSVSFNFYLTVQTLEETFSAKKRLKIYV
jgi:cytidylate kinase